MINFAQPWMLWGLFAVFLPVAIHLINRWRHKSTPWAAMAFLLEATREMRGRKQLRHYLILASRVLAVAALALSLSRPRSGSWLGFGSYKAENVLVIFDRSASMEGRPDGMPDSLREAALKRLQGTMGALKGTRFFLMESANARVAELSAPEVLPKLADVAATDTKADFPALLESASDYIRDNMAGRTEIWVVSDMQASSWQPESAKWDVVRSSLQALPDGVSVRILELRDRPSLNRSIRVKNARVKGGDLLLSLEMGQSGAGESGESQSVPVTISLNGGRFSDSVMVKNGVTRAEKVIKLPDDVQEGFGFISLPHDGNVRDDVSYFTFGREKPLRIAVLGKRGESLSALGNMAAPEGMAGRQLERLELSRLMKTDLSSFALIICDGELYADSEIRELENYVGKGGTVLFVPGEDETAGGVFLGVDWGKRQTADEDKLYVMERWEQETGPLRDGADGKPIPVDHTRAIIRTPILGAGTVLASWDDGSPALLRKVEGTGQALFLGTRPVYEWSNLGDGYMLLPLLQRLGAEGGLRFSSARSSDLGQEKRTFRPDQTPVRIDGYEASEVSSPFETTAGVYRVDDELFALNRPEEEDLPDEMESETEGLLFEGIDYSSLNGANRESASMVSEFWRVLYLFLLLMLISEALLSLPRALATVKRTENS